MVQCDDALHCVLYKDFWCYCCVEDCACFDVAQIAMAVLAMVWLEQRNEDFELG